MVMSHSALAVAPVLSTPESHIFEEPNAAVDSSSIARLSDEQLYTTYEIHRTVEEIRTGKWKRIALQFPDYMLVDAPRVFEALRRGLKETSTFKKDPTIYDSNDSSVKQLTAQVESINVSVDERLFILADTSYGACCVDEVAAEHANAEVVVHYGRSCLSPTARLPVIYVFTKPPLDVVDLVSAFKQIYKDSSDKVLLVADIPYASYIPEVAESLKQEGYLNVFPTSIVHDTASPIPNRTVPHDVISNPDILQSYRLFHVSDPPPSLLLILSSRVQTVHIYPTPTLNRQLNTPVPQPLLANTSLSLRRRYALLTAVATAPIIGILINTLSVRNYMAILTHIKSIIATAGKKSYTFVVGKVNAAKVANFHEVGGWVVVGCWESSLFESKDFWKPIVTPFELELALRGDDGRVWTGEWTSDYEAVLREVDNRRNAGEAKSRLHTSEVGQAENGHLGSEKNIGYGHADELDEDDEEESEPPEFDLRTGRYVSQTRPMGVSKPTTTVAQADDDIHSTAARSIIKRANGDLARVGGQVSPAAEVFKHQRSWQGLGSDFEIKYDERGVIKENEGAIMEEGRKGIAKGYTVGDDVERR